MKDFKSIKQYIVQNKNISAIIGLSAIIVISILLIVVRCIQNNNTSDVVVQTPIEVMLVMVVQILVQSLKMALCTKKMIILNLP